MQLKLELIAAACENMGIGNNGALPWRLKTEMEYFTRMTIDTKDKNKKNVVLMGRRTWDSIPIKYRPLNDRINMVLTSQSLDYGDKAIVCKSIPHALEVIAGMQNQIERVWIIGGSSVYKDAMESPHFGRLYLTRIKKEFECDTFFPPIPNDFVLVTDPAVPQDVQEEKGIKFVYEVYEKR
ncbi:dihydrofolate reductase isoform X2 [Linepithema humile]|nr:PREDICTED: dihydrofolate reductase isoform X2 [Linepithema humile]XP_012227899.1 PREDICTED: dihydrofolate reductase isoform X2 [Linepithema humile]XP_012227900.1 PREDICTED: dihydrofolate reductase isoform X2 [Linepithema humile]XP_012227901.1 PREDICTED: dihydrofolate reductase isoform X2 [Linepithema humile]XP_012227902.1 PREDICTED: dihydrofolate reductase isoform X2 [Linepithema humile]